VVLNKTADGTGKAVAQVGRTDVLVVVRIAQADRRFEIARDRRGHLAEHADARRLVGVVTIAVLDLPEGREIGVIERIVAVVEGDARDPADPAAGLARKPKLLIE